MKDENRIPKLVHELEYLVNHKIEVGILSGSGTPTAGGEDILSIAFTHEFGFSARNIPERSFMRAGFDENVDEIQRTAETLLDGVLQGRTTGKAMLEALGGVVVSMIQNYLTDLSTPPLSARTIEQKGSSNPLIDTGQLRSSITWKVVSA